MQDTVLVSLVAGAAACTVAIIPAVINAYIAPCARKAAERAEQTAADSKAGGMERATRIDGRMDELLELTRSTAPALGVLEEKQRGEAIAAAVKSDRDSSIDKRENLI